MVRVYRLDTHLMLQVLEALKPKIEPKILVTTMLPQYSGGILEHGQNASTPRDRGIHMTNMLAPMDTDFEST